MVMTSKKNVAEGCCGILELRNTLHCKFNKLPVFILVDEYDSPFYHAMEKLGDKNLANSVSIELEAFFDVIKNSVVNDVLGIALVVGVSRLPLPSFQTGANNFVDLTYDRDFAEAIGMRKSVLEQDEMKYHMQRFAEQTLPPSRKSLSEKGTNASKLDDEVESVNVINSIKRMVLAQFLTRSPR